MNAAEKASRAAKRARAPIDLSTRLALRIAEVARLIGVSPSTVRTMISRGELPGRRVGAGETAKSFVVPVDGLRAWLSGSKINGAQG
jgi:excisionase family DNA binding protein